MEYILHISRKENYDAEIFVIDKIVTRGFVEDFISRLGDERVLLTLDRYMGILKYQTTNTIREEDELYILHEFGREDDAKLLGEYSKLGEGGEDLLRIKCLDLLINAVHEAYDDVYRMDRELDEVVANLHKGIK